MSGKLMGALYKKDLPKPLRDVLLAMADHADDDGWGVWPSVGYLARKLGCDRRTVQRQIREAERRGILTKVREATPNNPAEYVIDIGLVEPKPPYRPPTGHRGGATSAPHREGPPVRHQRRTAVRHPRSSGATPMPPKPPRTVTPTGTRISEKDGPRRRSADSEAA